MADDQSSSQEKTEQPTSKRLKEAKEKGQIARSKDLNATIILLVSGISFLFFGKFMAKDLARVMIEAFSFTSEHLILPKALASLIFKVIKVGLYSMIPLLFAIVLASLFGPLSLGGWAFSGKSLAPKFSRLNPLKGFKRMVSLKGFVEMLKSLAKFIVVAICGILVIKMQLIPILGLTDYPPEIAISKGLWLLAWSFLIISSALILISLIDVPFQLYQHNEQLKMTKQEVKDEYKETEGKPEVKSQIRRMQQEIARQRMMQEVPNADVILTNPTHYAVAIQYEDGGSTAPRVIAKGKDFVALNINKIAKAHSIPTMRIPPLTRAIYFSTKLNHEIPRGLYVAVAQVLAYLFQLRKTYQQYDGSLPVTLKNLPIPEEYARDGED